MKNKKFRKGQIVYIQGRYKARVLFERECEVTCFVFEGLWDPKKAEHTYRKSMVKLERKVE